MVITSNKSGAGPCFLETKAIHEADEQIRSQRFTYHILCFSLCLLMSLIPFSCQAYASLSLHLKAGILRSIRRWASYQSNEGFDSVFPVVESV